MFNSTKIGKIINEMNVKKAAEFAFQYRSFYTYIATAMSQNKLRLLKRTK